MAPKNLAILVHDDVEVLDFCGPFEAFGVTGEAGEPYFNVFTVAEESRPVRANTGMIVQPNHTFDDCPPLFMLLIPGGNTSVLTENPRVMAWVAEQEKQVEHLVSVCTGAMVLAELGLLDGLEATTHYGSYDRLQEAAPAARTTRRAGRRQRPHRDRRRRLGGHRPGPAHDRPAARDAGGPRRGRVHDVPLGRRRPGPR